MVIKELVQMFSVFDENNLPETIFHRKVISRRVQVCHGESTINGDSPVLIVMLLKIYYTLR